MENTTKKTQETKKEAKKAPAPVLSIIAGGNGTRLFPISHGSCPKQFCRLNESDTFIQDSIKRFMDSGFDAKRIVIVVTNDKQYELALEQTQGLGVIEPNILLIPPCHDYAGAMTVSDDFIEEKFGDVVIVHTPADQYVVRGEAFTSAVRSLCESAAKTPSLLGVFKSDLNTVMGCGNIYFEDGDGAVRLVKGFEEKPPKEIAEQMHMSAEEAGLVKSMLDNARLVSRAKAENEPEEDPEEEEKHVEDTALFQMRQRITDLLSVLTQEEAELLRLRFGLEGGMPLTPEQTGRKLGLTPEEVVQKEAAALMKLRNEG